MKEPTITETQLFDEFGDPAAISVSLDDVSRFIRHFFPNLIVSVHYEDYDDYGCEHYVLIKGECADIRLEKDYGGMFCQTDRLILRVETYDKFTFKKRVEEIAINSDYATKIKYLLDLCQPLLNYSDRIYSIKETENKKEEIYIEADFYKYSDEYEASEPAPHFSYLKIKGHSNEKFELVVNELTRKLLNGHLKDRNLKLADTIKLNDGWLVAIKGSVGNASDIIAGILAGIDPKDFDYSYEYDEATQKIVTRIQNGEAALIKINLEKYKL